MLPRTTQTETPRGKLAEVLRSPLGNLLLAINLALIVRGCMVELAYMYRWADAGCFGYAPYVDVIGLPLSPIYSLMHAPAWFCVGLLAWLLKPLLIVFDPDCLYRLTQVAFVPLSSLQWLVAGYLIERMNARRAQNRSEDAALRVTPDLAATPRRAVQPAAGSALLTAAHSSRHAFVRATPAATPLSRLEIPL